jgi:hypothetical protein
MSDSNRNWGKNGLIREGIQGFHSECVSNRTCATDRKRCTHANIYSQS